MLLQVQVLSVASATVAELVDALFVEKENNIPGRQLDQEETLTLTPFQVANGAT